MCFWSSSQYWVRVIRINISVNHEGSMKLSYDYAFLIWEDSIKEINGPNLEHLTNIFKQKFIFLTLNIFKLKYEKKV